MKQDKWTQQLRDKLADHQVPPPADLWSDIEAAMPQSPRNRLVALRRWAVAAAVVALICGGGVVWWIQQQMSEASSALAEDMNMPKSAEDINMPQSAGGVNMPPAIKQPEEFLAQVGAPAPGEVKRQNVQTPAVNSDLPVDKGDDPVEATEQTPIVDNQESSQPTSQPKPQSNGHLVPQTNGHLVPQTNRLLVQQKNSQPDNEATRRPTPDISLYAANGMAIQDNVNAVLMSDMLAQNYNSTNTNANMQVASRQAPIFLTGYEEKQHHDMPVALGVSVSYPLTNRLSLTSGIIYTRLHSVFTQKLRSQQYSMEQTLHYIGIPLGLSYSIWQHKNFRCYLTASAQADWNVSIQTETEGVKQTADRDRMQWSVGGSLGLQYAILPQLSLFAEPGISHYFDNGSPVQNYFKDKPTSLRLQVGLRLNLQNKPQN